MVDTRYPSVFAWRATNTCMPSPQPFTCQRSKLNRAASYVAPYVYSNYSIWTFASSHTPTQTVTTLPATLLAIHLIGYRVTIEIHVYYFIFTCDNFKHSFLKPTCFICIPVIVAQTFLRQPNYTNSVGRAQRVLLMYKCYIFLFSNGYSFSLFGVLW